MNEIKIYGQIKPVLVYNLRNQYTAELHLQMIKYVHELKNITAKEFCKEFGLRQRFGIEFSKMRNLTQCLKAAGLKPRANVKRCDYKMPENIGMHYE